MKNKINICLSVGLFLPAMFLSSCFGNNFASEKMYKYKIEERVNATKKLAHKRAKELFGVFDKDISKEEREYLKFLYAYMPLCDLADYNGEFFLKHVKSSIRARKTFLWSKKIPEKIFRHFVLVPRVGSEKLDLARLYFYEELKDRIKGLSLKEAILEINHWCHEKVTYQPADGRTSSPLATLKTGYGRCGEETVVTIGALRSVGIPARQIYTPRWAHTDSNHAWVEVWLDGNWYYFGACEPEPELNMGWFKEAARRTMLVFSDVFGDFNANDEIVNKNENYTRINILSHYADAKKIFVKVIDEDEQPVKNAKVDFEVYNYGRFCPIAKLKTDNKGLASLTTGLGDVFVRARKDGKDAAKKISVTKDSDMFLLRLEKDYKGHSDSDLVFHPPVEKRPYRYAADARKQKDNEIRLKEEDRIREEYIKTFTDENLSFEIADRLGTDRNETWTFLDKSEGNWREIKEFIETRTSENKEAAYKLLENISDKDLRDITADILYDHFDNTLKKYNRKDYKSDDIYYKYMLNPRIYYENIVAYRKHFQDKFADIANLKRSEIVAKLLTRIKKDIRIQKE
ncbi:MAG: transglutaminase domain-containing protein, partial [Deltaproteobacteria bacterium]|nr:transglutaminase domain-containing protein [Deltaproteobacteria bacterium]